MSQRGFTLLEMMLVLLLIGVSASMVLLAFPSARPQEATQILARFQAQLDFVRERGQQTGQLFGIIIHPERWQFMRLQPADDSAPAATTGGATRSGCRCRPDASPRRKPSRGPG